MPAPIWLAFAALVGWPLLQLASVLLVRPLRARMRRVADELSRDGQYGPDDRALVQRLVRESRGVPAFVAFPILLPLGLVAASIVELVGRDRPQDGMKHRPGQTSRDIEDPERSMGRRTGAERVHHDVRFETLAGLAFEISVLRWPLTTFLTILLCIPVLPLLALAYGLRQIGMILTGAAGRLAISLRFTAQGMPGRR